MGGCITPPTKKPKNPHKPQTPKTPLNETSQPNLQTPFPNNPPLKPTIIQQKPKYKKITDEQFCRLYRIEDNVGLTSRAQGPKYISNYADGLGKVLRVIPYSVLVNSSGIGNYNSNKESQVQRRVKAYAQILGLQIYEDEQNNLLVLQDYYCGPYLHQLTGSASSGSTNTQQSQITSQEQIRCHLSAIHTLIEAFHQRNIIIGNLTIFTFRQTSSYDNTVQMVQLNILGNMQQNMGHAFKNQKAMDWQSFAFIVQSVITESPPIFIPHKLQYIENSNNVVYALLKGKKIKRQELDTLGYKISSTNLILGYKLRYNLNKLLKQRKRRTQHRAMYYSEQYFNIDEQQKQKLPDETIHRMQTNRIFQSISQFIGLLNVQCQESFIMYSSSVSGEVLKKLRVVFVGGGENRMEEFKETLPLIK